MTYKLYERQNIFVEIIRSFARHCNSYKPQDCIQKYKIWL